MRRNLLRRTLPLLMLLAGLLAASAAQAAVTPAFTDVSPADSNASFINYLNSRGIVGGFPDGTYQPGGVLTRAEAAAVLVKAAGLAESAGPSDFSDVNGHWAAGVINAAAAAGMISGDPDGTFRPDDVITRAEGISMFLRLSRQPDPGVALPALGDVTRGHWAARPVAIGLAAGLVRQVGNNFLPDSGLTRGDMARMLGMLLTKDPGLSRKDLKITVRALTGTVSVTRRGSDQAEDIETGAGTEVFAGDTIRTGTGGTAEMLLPDGSGMLLEEGTELTVKEARGRSYVTAGGSAGTAVDWLEVNMEKGNMFGTLAKYSHKSADTESAGENISGANIRDLPPVAGLDDWSIKGLLLAAGETGEAPWWEAANSGSVRVQVDMPWGVAGVRGTTWRIALDDQSGASFSILEGEGELTAGGVTGTVGEQQVISIPYGGTPGSANQMSPEELEQFVTEAVQGWLEQRAEDMQANSELHLQVEGTPPPSVVEIINRAIEQAVHEVQQATNPPNNHNNNNNTPDPDDDGEIVDSPWPMFRHDARHTGISEYAGPTDPEIKWASEGDMDYPASSPAIGGDGTIYTNVDMLGLVAIKTDGTTCNFSEAMGSHLSTPAIMQDGIVCVASYNGLLGVKKDQDSDLSVAWSYDIDEPIFGNSSPIIAPDDTVYFETNYLEHHTKLHAVTVSTDDNDEYSVSSWVYDFGSDIGVYYYDDMPFEICSSPALGPDGKVVYVAGNDGLYAIDVVNRSLKWHYGSNPITAPPFVCSDGTVCVAEGDCISLVNPEDGSLKYDFGAGGAVLMSPIVSQDGDTVYYGTSDGTFHAFNYYNSANQDESVNISDYCLQSSPAMGPDGTVYFGTKEGFIYALDSVTGEIKWVYLTGLPMKSSPAIGADGTLYIGTDYGNVIALKESNTGPVVNKSNPEDGGEIEYGLSSIVIFFNKLVAVNTDNITISWKESESDSVYTPLLLSDDFYCSDTAGMNNCLTIYCTEGDFPLGYYQLKIPNIDVQDCHENKMDEDYTLEFSIVTQP